MTVGLRAEYVGFVVDETSRIYTLLVRHAGGESHEMRFAIANEAFLTGRVRYQDAAEICYLRLDRELREGGEKTLSSAVLKISNDELNSYREAHTKKPRTPSFSTLNTNT